MLGRSAGRVARGAGLRGASPSIAALLIDARPSVSELLGGARLQLTGLGSGAGRRVFSADAPAGTPKELKVYIRRQLGGADVSKVTINADADVADLVKMAAAEVLPGVASSDVVVSRINSAGDGAEATPLIDLEETVSNALPGARRRIVVSLRPPPVPVRARSGGTSSVIRTDSPTFFTLRDDGNPFIDKSGAVARLLVDVMSSSSRVFFTRPRRFGKSLTLSIASELLAAGTLPEGVRPWGGFVGGDAAALFKGLEAERMLLPSGSLLKHGPYFVVHVDLPFVQSGSELKGGIINKLADVAGVSFGPAVKADVLRRVSPGDALLGLISAVPRGVPVALLVDEYDAAIIADVAKNDWAAARAGVDAIRSLLLASKDADGNDRIKRCIVTGVAVFARTSLFSGANHFADLTGHEAVDKALGFTAEEIRTTFPAALARLATNERAKLVKSGYPVNVDGAMRLLEEWYK